MIRARVVVGKNINDVAVNRKTLCVKRTILFVLFMNTFKTK